MMPLEGAIEISRQTEPMKIKKEIMEKRREEICMGEDKQGASLCDSHSSVCFFSLLSCCLSTL